MQSPLTFDVPVTYDKSRYFRVIHADGAYGGVAPSGYLHIGLFNERHPLPTKSSLTVSADGMTPPQEQVVERSEGIFRELEVDVVVDMNTAIGIHAWLADKIFAMAEQLGVSREDVSSLMKQRTELETKK